MNLAKLLFYSFAAFKMHRYSCVLGTKHNIDLSVPTLVRVRTLLRSLNVHYLCGNPISFKDTFPFVVIECKSRSLAGD